MGFASSASFCPNYFNSDSGISRLTIMRLILVASLALLLVVAVGFASAEEEAQLELRDEPENGDVVGYGKCGIFNMKACCQYCKYCTMCNDPKYCPGNPNCKYCNKCFLCKKIC